MLMGTHEAYTRRNRQDNLVGSTIERENVATIERNQYVVMIFTSVTFVARRFDNPVSLIRNTQTLTERLSGYTE